ncbi:MAG: glutamate-1-semialdehyde 2,1-aminomutase [Thermoleophilia bacterium]|nr:glutamate-1-semialdehyde 2,1-aminomutase [Thermoleophilia bacterium]MDH3724602.1 glutamate-1-semialdehyde 2,1-aminomutase [Thermoleophilia bacterium]
MSTAKSSALYARARRHLVGGVNSPVRAMTSIGREPLFIARAEGAYVWDVDGNRYVDYLGTWGPAMLGHAPPAVIDAVSAALPAGTSFGAPTEREVIFAEAVCEAVPSVEQLRMTSSGSEAVMGALRVARAATGRAPIVKTIGGYHGALDPLLAEAGSGATTLGVPNSPGVPEGATANTRLVPFNDPAAAAEALEEAAAIIVEPVAGNMGVIPPQPGYLESLREACDASGALLIFDEVMTGFRVARGGAQERYGVTPDLTCLGKVIGGGLPVGAFGGRRDIMGVLAPEGPCYQAGTLSGNPLATAAGLAALGELAREGVYEQVEQTSAALEEAIAASGAPVVVNRVGAMLTPFFTQGPVTDYRTATASDTDAFAAFARKLIDAGVYPPPSQFEAWFVGLAHDESHIEQTREALAAAA